MPGETLISNLVILIYHVAQQSASAGQMISLIPKGAFQQSRIVTSCGEVMKEYLSKNGNVVCNATKLFCKNKSLGEVTKPVQQENEGVFWVAIEDILDLKELERLRMGFQIAR